MLVYNQSWVGAPSPELMQQAGPLWNMWKTRKFPFHELTEGQSVLMMTTKSDRPGLIMYESRTRYLLKEWYSSKSDAWKKLESSIPKKYRLDENGNVLDKKYFLSRTYTINAPNEGWLISWLDEPIRWLGKKRPGALLLRRNGWGEMPRRDVQGRRTNTGYADISKSKIENQIKEILDRVDIGPREKQTLI